MVNKLHGLHGNNKSNNYYNQYNDQDSQSFLYSGGLWCNKSIKVKSELTDVSAGFTNFEGAGGGIRPSALENIIDIIIFWQ